MEASIRIYNSLSTHIVELCWKIGPSSGSTISSRDPQQHHSRDSAACFLYLICKHFWFPFHQQFLLVFFFLFFFLHVSVCLCFCSILLPVSLPSNSRVFIQYRAYIICRMNIQGQFVAHRLVFLRSFFPSESCG